jgi:hypothetical protein
LNSLAPIVLFVYNRPWHTEQTLNALLQNELADQSILYIYSDGPKEDASEEQLNKIIDVRKVIRIKKWCKEVHIIEAEKNKGLAEAVIDGVTTIVNQYGKIIVLEDDLVTSKGFLLYMNESLKMYTVADEVMQISGYQFPLGTKARGRAYFLELATSWGWGTWKRAWNYFDSLANGYEALKINKSLSYQFDLDGTYPYTKMLIRQMEQKTISSWAIRWWWSVFNNKGLVLYPDVSLIKNIGFDGSGIHSGSNNPYRESDWNNAYAIKNFPRKLIADNKKGILLKKYLNNSVTIKLHKKNKCYFFNLILKYLNKIFYLSNENVYTK